MSDETATENPTATDTTAAGTPAAPATSLPALEDVEEAMRDVVDPELGINVVDLGLVYGIEVTDEALSIDTISDVCMNGPGHYLGHGQTLKLMQTEYFYPAVGDRFSPKEWNEKGRPDIVARAIAEKRRILATHFPDHVARALDERLRARFPAIQLPRSSMEP